MKFSPSCMEAMWERWRSLAVTHTRSHTRAHAPWEAPLSHWDLQGDTEADRHRLGGQEEAASGVGSRRMTCSRAAWYDVW